MENEINSIAHLDEFDASGSLRSLASSIDVKVDSIIEGILINFELSTSKNNYWLGLNSLKSISIWYQYSIYER